jgi:hypothetical protein
MIYEKCTLKQMIHKLNLILKSGPGFSLSPAPSLQAGRISPPSGQAPGTGAAIALGADCADRKEKTYARHYYSFPQVDAISPFSLITPSPGSVSGIRYGSLAIWGHRRGAQIARPVPNTCQDLIQLLSRVQGHTG